MKQSIPKSPLFLITIGLNSPLRGVVAWGHEGHAIIADVAYGQLSSSTQKAVTDILFPNSNSTYDKTKYASLLSAVASWADAAVQYTEEFSWTSPLHFVDIRDDLIHGGCPSTSNSSSNSSNDKDSSECTFDYDRDCNNGLCAINAIQQLTTFLYNQTMPLSPPSTSTSISNSQQQDIFHQWQNTPALRSLRGKSTSVSHPINFTTRQSLMFLIHFIGDIHQPLHVSRKSDIGGNSIHVTFPFLFYGSSSNNNNNSNHHRHERYGHALHKGWNLHSVWDTGIIEYTIQNKFHKNQSDFQSFIQETFVTKDNIHKWTVEKCSNAKNQNCISIWAEESWDDALHWAYGDENATEIHDGAVITEMYIESRLPIIETRLAAGGVRLAFVLEMIYGSLYQGIRSGHDYDHEYEYGSIVHEENKNNVLKTFL